MMLLYVYFYIVGFAAYFYVVVCRILLDFMHIIHFQRFSALDTAFVQLVTLLYRLVGLNLVPTV